MSTTMMMNPAQPQHLPHRKPVPGRPTYNNNVQQQQQYPTDPGSRAASIARPPSGSPSMTTMTPQQQQQQQHNQQNRRTPSSATSSTSSMSISNTNNGLQRIPTNASAAPRRSTSSRSTSSASPTSYVALMRKQKATVWCDRAQAEDPRILATQRAAKMRAAMEVAGGSHRFSTSSNTATSTSTGIRSKIRHHGAPKASTYTGQANLAGAGVPMRLSASEVSENDSDEEDSKYVSHYHMRNGSRNSSMGSNAQRGAMYPGSGPSSTPGSGRSPDGTMGNLIDEETPVPTTQNQNAGDYLSAGASEEQIEASYGNLSALPQRTGDVQQTQKSAEELRRRGSVDDRSMTMTGTRLFIANPDNDSD